MTAKTSDLRIRTPHPFKRLLLGEARRDERHEPGRQPLESYIGFRPQRTEAEMRAEAQGFLDEVESDLLTLSVNLDALVQALELVGYDHSVRAAAASVRVRLGELMEVQGALSDILVACTFPSAARLLVPDAALADYIRSVVAWCTGVVRALEQLAVELQYLAADWATLRSRLDDASAFFVHELGRAVRAELAAQRGEQWAEDLAHLAERLEALFAAAEWLSEGLSQRFG